MVQGVQGEAISRGAILEVISGRGMDHSAPVGGAYMYHNYLGVSYLNAGDLFPSISTISLSNEPGVWQLLWVWQVQSLWVTSR